MKTLVAFYSRTGITKKAALQIAKKLKADIEEIISVKGRKGIVGFLVSGSEAVREKAARIKPARKDVSRYDLIIICTPVWANNMSSPIRAYIEQNREKFKEVAFACTMGKTGGSIAIAKMEKLCRKKAAAKLTATSREVMSGAYNEKLKVFAQKIRQKN